TNSVSDHQLAIDQALLVTCTKQLPNIFKIEVFGAQNFRHCRNASTQFSTSMALHTPSQPQGQTPTPPTNKLLIGHNTFMILKYITKDVVRQRFIIGNYYCWEMAKDKDIKVQLNEYHKLLEELKAKNTCLHMKVSKRQPRVCYHEAKALTSKANQSGHHAPQCKYRVARNDNPPKPKANLAKDDIIVVLVYQANIVTNVSKWVVDFGTTHT
ncbi:hypothetical protein CR513_34458, partial [Mucuna pruriens]